MPFVKCTNCNDHGLVDKTNTVCPSCVRQKKEGESDKLFCREPVVAGDYMRLWPEADPEVIDTWAWDGAAIRVPISKRIMKKRRSSYLTSCVKNLRRKITVYNNDFVSAYYVYGVKTKYQHMHPNIPPQWIEYLIYNHFKEVEAYVCDHI